MAQPSRYEAPWTGLLLGDEAVALAALHAGISAAYSYPGTPATEILEFVAANAGNDAVARWCANEKTAYEQALGVSMMGRRALVSMKHVGLNVAADAFVNSALVDIGGGLVVAVGDDPGMHSSQNEQDSRYLADFARVPCLEPATRQEAYAMTRAAFDLSERFAVPVVVRLVTRLCHGRSPVRAEPALPARPIDKAADPRGWTLIPANARRQWRKLLDAQAGLADYGETTEWNVLRIAGRRLGVVTCGVARNYLEDALGDLDEAPSHLHVGAYPAPVAKLRRLAEAVQRVLVLEDGYPFLERRLRGTLPTGVPIDGRESGALPRDGELTPDRVRAALGQPARTVMAPATPVPPRPPRLCRGCPHADSFEAVRAALGDFVESAVTADIGCYTLGALPPHEAIESCVCMGASIGMAIGAADAGMRPVLAVIGDGTFLHSGLAPVLDAAAADAPITVLILDNQTVAMTGLQPTVVPDTRLAPILAGLGVDPGHLHVVELRPHRPDELASLLRKELEHDGLSVIVAVRACVELAKQQRQEQLVKADVVLAGVGGQGVLTAAALLAEAGMRDGLTVRQGEVHGMSQRGGAVQATLRLADAPLAGDLVASGTADVVLSLEPLEAVRCLPFLAPGGWLLTASEPYDDLPDYPEIGDLLRQIEQVPGSLVVDATALARGVKSPRSANVVMIGVALSRLPLAPATVTECVRDLFAVRGSRIVERNLAALEAGQSVAVAL